MLTREQVSRTLLALQLCACGGITASQRELPESGASADPDSATGALEDSAPGDDARADAASSSDTEGGDAAAGDGSDVTPCIGGGNILYMDGDPGDFINPGVTTITAAAWGSTAQPPVARPYEVDIAIRPTDPSLGPLWEADFSAEHLGMALSVRSYTDAQRLPFATAGHPGLEVIGNGRGCNAISGSFTIYDLTVDDSGTVRFFTASFVQHCEGAAPALRGCVHFHQ